MPVLADPFWTVLPVPVTPAGNRTGTWDPGLALIGVDGTGDPVFFFEGNADLQEGFFLKDGESRSFMELSYRTQVSRPTQDDMTAGSAFAFRTASETYRGNLWIYGDDAIAARAFRKGWSLVTLFGGNIPDAVTALMQAGRRDESGNVLRPVYWEKDGTDNTFTPADIEPGTPYFVYFSESVPAFRFGL
jgi:hypothetical protein